MILAGTAVSVTFAILWVPGRNHLKTWSLTCLVVDTDSLWDLSCAVTGPPPRGLPLWLPDFLTVWRPVTGLSIPGGSGRDVLPLSHGVASVAATG